MAKDVSVFLAWAAEPDHDDRKVCVCVLGRGSIVCWPAWALTTWCVTQRLGLKWLSALVLMAAFTGYYKRFRWSPLKTRKITY